MNANKVSEAIGRLTMHGDAQLLADIAMIAGEIEQAENPKAAAKSVRVVAVGAMSLTPIAMIINNTRDFAEQGKEMLRGVGHE